MQIPETDSYKWEFATCLILREQKHDSVRKKDEVINGRKLAHNVKNNRSKLYLITYFKNYTQMDQKQKHEKQFK